jgi:hypothetical protein
LLRIRVAHRRSQKNNNSSGNNTDRGAMLSAQASFGKHNSRRPHARETRSARRLAPCGR